MSCLSETPGTKQPQMDKDFLKNEALLSQNNTIQESHSSI